MSKNRAKIGLSIDKEIDDKLESGNYNKSKLINSLLQDWLNSDKKDIKKFIKKSD
jgi:Arc/MetJ-type ribon-helix-helix transcriptional regulator